MLQLSHNVAYLFNWGLTNKGGLATAVLVHHKKVIWFQRADISISWAMQRRLTNILFHCCWNWKWAEDRDGDRTQISRWDPGHSALFLSRDNQAEILPIFNYKIWMHDIVDITIAEKPKNWPKIDLKQLRNPNFLWTIIIVKTVLLLSFIPTTPVD